MVHLASDRQNIFPQEKKVAASQLEKRFIHIRNRLRFTLKIHSNLSMNLKSSLVPV